MRPVWSLNVVAVDAQNEIASNAEYFKICKQKLEDFDGFLRKNRNDFIGSRYPRNDSEKSEVIEATLVNELLGFLRRLIAILSLIKLLDNQTLRKIRLTTNEY
jgi:hypothetical protein